MGEQATPAGARHPLKCRGLNCTRDRRSAEGLFRFMSANQACFPIATMAQLLGVSKAGYHAWFRRPPRPMPSSTRHC